MSGKTENAKCYFCGKYVDDDSYCYGCHEYVCEECGTNPDYPFGGHNVEDHREEGEDVQGEDVQW